jgi:hypothetical protein
MNYEEILLGRILQATRLGTIAWTSDGPDCHEGVGGMLRVRIQFRYPLMADETTSGADLVQVTAGRLCMAFASGTKGMAVVRDILAAGVPSWAEHERRVADCVSEVLSMLDEVTSMNTDA